MPRLPGIAMATPILVAAPPARPARDVVDDAGRTVTLPERAERVYLSPRLPFGWLGYPPGANRRVGLLRLPEILYPDLLRFDYPREIARFCRLFHHHEPTAKQVAGLLAEPGVSPR